MTVETNRELKQQRRQRQRKHLGDVDYSMFASSFIVDRACCKWTGANIVNEQNERFTYIRKFYFDIWLTTSKNFLKFVPARAARLFFLIQPIRSLLSGVVVAIAIVLA